MGWRDAFTNSHADETEDQSSRLVKVGKWGANKAYQAYQDNKEKKAAWGPRELEIRAWQKAMLAPVVTSATTAVAGLGGHLVAQAQAGSSLGAAALAGVSVAGVSFVVRAGASKVFVKRWESLYWITAGVITAWIAFAVAFGMTWLLGAALTISTVALGTPWWRGHPQPKSTAQEEPMQELPSGADMLEIETAPAKSEADLIADQIQSLFYQHFALDTRGRLGENAYLENRRLINNGVVFDVQVDPDKYTFADIEDIHPRLSAIMGRHLKLTKGDILIEPHPTEDFSKGQITFTTHNPLKDGVAYQGPRYKDGYIAVGPWRDGQSWGSIQLSDHKATVINGLVTGDPGTGKSVFLENLGMSALASGVWKVFYTDGSEDADSSQLLNDYMTWSQAGLGGARRQLKAVKDYLALRGVENNALPPDIRGVNPSPERVGLVWIIDELHRLVTVDREFAEELAQVVRLGRKKGVAVWGATQGVDLKDDFGGIAALRDILTSRNVISFYSSSTYGHTMISGPKASPNTLPTGGGYAYLKTPALSRAAMLRTDFAEDMTKWAKQIPNHEWDKAGWLAVKKHIEANQESHEEKREEAQRRYKMMKLKLEHGLPLDDEEGTGGGIQARNGLSGAMGDLMAKLPTPAFADDLTITAKPENGFADEAELDRLHAEILELVRKGVTRTGDIVARIQARAMEEQATISERTIKRKLSELVKMGKLEQPLKQGDYQIRAA